MNKRLKTVGGLGAALAVGALLSPLTTATAGHANRVLTAELDGRQEVVADATDARIAGSPTGSGEAYVFGIDNDALTLCYVLTVEGIATATAAHIHEAAAGANGPVVASLGAPADGNAADCLTEGEPGKFPTGEAGIVARILANPEGFYVNVHNAGYPGGAIRGQLGAQG